MGETVLSAERISQIGMIEQVEKLSAKLCGEPFMESPGFRDRKIPVAEARIAEFIASHGSESAESRRQHQRIAVGIAAKRAQGRAIQPIWIAAIEGKRLRNARRIRLARKEWNPDGCGLEGRWIAEEIPPII